MTCIFVQWLYWNVFWNKNGPVDWKNNCVYILIFDFQRWLERNHHILCPVIILVFSKWIVHPLLWSYQWYEYLNCWIFCSFCSLFVFHSCCSWDLMIDQKLNFSFGVQWLQNQQILFCMYPKICWEMFKLNLFERKVLLLLIMDDYISNKKSVNVGFQSSWVILINNSNFSIGQSLVAEFGLSYSVGQCAKHIAKKNLFIFSCIITDFTPVRLTQTVGGLPTFSPVMYGATVLAKCSHYSTLGNRT